MYPVHVSPLITAASIPMLSHPIARLQAQYLSAFKDSTLLVGKSIFGFTKSNFCIILQTWREGILPFELELKANNYPPKVLE